MPQSLMQAAVRIDAYIIAAFQQQKTGGRQQFVDLSVDLGFYGSIGEKEKVLKT